MTPELIQHDLRAPLPARLHRAFDVASTDPPYTVAGASLFLSRAVAALGGDAGQHVFFSFGARRPGETLRTQELITGMGLTVRAMTPNFNEYVGAGILAGTSHLYHLRSTASPAPLITGDYQGPLYTADLRAAVTRPYRCAGCGAVHAVGPGAQWTRIASLQAAGLPGLRWHGIPPDVAAAAMTGTAPAARPGKVPDPPRCRRRSRRHRAVRDRDRANIV